VSFEPDVIGSRGKGAPSVIPDIRMDPIVVGAEGDIIVVLR